MSRLSLRSGIRTPRLLACVAITAAACGDGAPPVVDREPPATPPEDIALGKASPPNVDARGVGRTVDFTVAAAGRYYFSAYAMGTSQAGVDVYVDDAATPAGTLAAGDGGWTWQAVSVEGRATPISLSAGRHALSFRSRGDHVPDVESVRLSSAVPQLEARPSAYASYIADLAARSLPADQVTAKSHQVKADAVLAPDNYCYSENQPVTYTYYSWFYFSAGQQVAFETQANGHFSDPVMYLFDGSTDTAAGNRSWSNDDYNGVQSKIAVTIPATGYYVLFLRAYSASYPSTTDLLKDGSLFASNIPLAGARLDCANDTNLEDMNYFTANLSSGVDTRIWIVDNGPSVGSVEAFNDDYFGTGTLVWPPASRVKSQLARPASYMLVSAYSASDPAGTADFYMKVRRVSPAVGKQFGATLNADDAMRSAPFDDTYNCFAYAGGITNQWVVPDDVMSPWLGATEQASYDNYFGNTPPRYPGATTYTRTGATEANAVIDLWQKDATFVHASVRKPGNAMPHGYDWESKPGYLDRTFHPRYAIAIPSYGSVTARYIRAGGGAKARNAEPTLASAVQNGQAVVERVGLDDGEMAKLARMKTAVDAPSLAEFEARYTAWKETWARPEIAAQSRPRAYAASGEYRDLLALCRQMGERSWPLVFEKYAQGDFPTLVAIEDLTLPAKSDIAEAVQRESAQERHAPTGALLVPSLVANGAKFVKRVLAESVE
jgi:hypothetical protein